MTPMCLICGVVVSLSIIVAPLTAASSARSKSRPAEVRRAISAWRQGDRAPVETLLKSPRAGYLGVNALAAVGDPAAEGRLLELLRGPNEELAFLSAAPLAKIGSKRATEALFAVLRSETGAATVQYGVAGSLAEMGSAEVFARVQRTFLAAKGERVGLFARALYESRRALPDDIARAVRRALRTAWEQELIEEEAQGRSTVGVARSLERLYVEMGEAERAADMRRRIKQATDSQ